MLQLSPEVPRLGPPKFWASGNSNKARPMTPGRGCRWQGRTNLGTGHEWGWWLQICPMLEQPGNMGTGTLVLP